MRFCVRKGALFALLAVGIAACGGGGGGSSSSGGGVGTVPVTNPTATPVPIAPTSSTTSAPLGASVSTVSFGAISNGSSNVIASSTVTLPVASVATSASISLSAQLPSGASQPAYRALRGRNVIGGQNINPLAYYTLSVSSTTSISATPAVTIAFDSPILGSAYIAVEDEAVANWTVLTGPITATTNSLTVPSQTVTPPVSLLAGHSYVFCLFTATAVPTPTPVPTATPTATPVPSSAPLPQATGSPLAGPSFGPDGQSWTPTNVANTLDFPVQHGFDGRGLTAAVIIDDSPSNADIQNYLSFNQTPLTGRTITTVPIDGGGSNAASALEGALDVETIAGLAPGANIAIYDIPDLNDQSITDALASIVSNDAAQVVSMSFGGCELQSESSMEDPQFAQGASQGQAFVASSGDQGNACYTGLAAPQQYTEGVNYPASNANVIGVGGNETNNVGGGGALTNPVAWNDHAFSTRAQGATGGGVSTLYPLPTYQTGYAVSSGGRNVPDVAMPAEDTYVIVNSQGGAALGTSWSAPQAAAMLTEVFEYCNASGFVDPVQSFYYAAQHSSNSYIDITQGSNQYGSFTPAYSAGAGFDNTTGFGLVKGFEFASTICPNRVPALHRSQRFATAPSIGYAAAQSRALALPTLSQRLPDLGRRPLDTMTRIQVALRPNPSIASDEATVIGALRAAGFTIVQTFGNHLVIDAQAPSGTVERYFATTMHDYAQDTASPRYAAQTGATIPAEIAPYVNGISLDNLIVAKPASASRYDAILGL